MQGNSSFEERQRTNNALRILNDLYEQCAQRRYQVVRPKAMFVRGI